MFRETINIVVLENNNVLELTTIIVNSDDDVRKAEELFKQKAIELGWDDDDDPEIEVFIEDGYFKHHDKSVCIHWNKIEISTPTYISKMDWELLRKQKADLLQTIVDMRDESTEAKSKNMFRLYRYLTKQVDSIEGILNLIDAVQDYAVDELGIDEKTVFNLPEESKE